MVQSPPQHMQPPSAAQLNPYNWMTFANSNCTIYSNGESVIIQNGPPPLPAMQQQQQGPTHFGVGSLPIR